MRAIVSRPPPSSSGTSVRSSRCRISDTAPAGAASSVAAGTVNQVMSVDTRPDAARNRGLKAHWAGVALERLQQERHTEDALLSYSLFAIGEHDFARVRRLHIEHFERIREIVAASKPADRVVLMNLQLIPLRAEPRGPQQPSGHSPATPSAPSSSRASSAVIVTTPHSSGAMRARRSR